MAAIAYTILQNAVIRLHGKQSLLATAVGSDAKGKVSIVLYLAAIGLAFLNTWLSISLYAIVACLWLVPDRRIEKLIND